MFLALPCEENKFLLEFEKDQSMLSPNCLESSLNDTSMHVFSGFLQKSKLIIFQEFSFCMNCRGKLFQTLFYFFTYKPYPNVYSINNNENNLNLYINRLA